MSSAFVDWIRRSFNQGPKRTHSGDFDSATGEFTLPDPEDLADELRIRQRASRDADDDYPAPNATEPAGIQREIFQYCHNRATENYQSAGRVIAQYEESIANVDLRSELQEIKNLPETLRAKLAALVSEKTEALASTKRKIQAAERDYKDFRTENRLSREPDYPRSYILRRGWLFLAVVLETGLNGYFFSGGNEKGYVGGGVIAFGLALVDIVGSWGVGRFVPHVTSRRAIHKVVGVVAILFVSFWLIAYNLGVAHYRDFMHQPEIIDTKLMMSSVVAHPFTLENPGSWILFIVGAAFSLLAIIDGVFWDDAYPGYGALHRKLEELQEDSIQIVTSIGQEAAAHRESCYEAVDALVRKSRNAIGSLRGWIGALEALVGKASAYVDSWQEIAQTLVSRYQSENERYRSSSSPVYFGRTIEPIEVIRHEIRREFHSQQLEKQEAFLDRILTVKEATRNSISQVYQDVLEELQAIRADS